MKSKLPKFECGKSYCVVSHNVEFVRKLLDNVLKTVKPEDKLVLTPEDNIGIDEIRSVLDYLEFGPYGESKWVVVYDADRFTEEAANAFLKTLEEPPAYATIVFVTKRYYALLPTIRSRVLNYFVPVSDLEGLDEFGKYLALWNFDFAHRLKDQDFELSDELETIVEMTDELSQILSLKALVERAVSLGGAEYVDLIARLSKVSSFKFLKNLAKVLSWIYYTRTDMPIERKLELTRRCDEILKSKLSNFNYQLTYYSLLLPLKFDVAVGVAGSEQQSSFNGPEVSDL